MKRGAFNISMREDGESVLDFAARILKYDPATGEFCWAETRNGRALSGSVAGSINEDGYVVIRVDGKLLLAHRLAMYFVRRESRSLEVDHRNGIRNDNRIDNLRWADDFANAQNLQKATKRSSTGRLGVFMSGKRFRAQIRENKKATSLGTFATAEEAEAAYQAAKEKRAGRARHA